MTAATPVQAVLFDLDGTLLDTLPDLVQALNAALAAAGRSAISREFLLPAVSTGTRTMLARAAPDAGELELERLRANFLSNYETSLGAHTQSVRGMSALLESLQRQQMPCGVVTNKLERYTEPLLRHLGMRDRFNCVICGDTAAAPKPSPAPLLAAAAELGLAPEHCVYIGDAPGDVHAANAAAMPVLVAAWGYVDPGDDPRCWGESTLVRSPGEVGNWLERHNGGSE
ncbi:MAG: HAD family hydrolase [Gammaproteobacteria bacterium]